MSNPFNFRRGGVVVYMEHELNFSRNQILEPFGYLTVEAEALK